MDKPLYLIVGASGSGKDYIVDKLCKELNKARVISRTTRPSRGKNDLHIFVDDDTALKELPFSIAQSDYNGYQYYVLHKDVDEADFYIVDVKGVRSLRNEKVLGYHWLKRDIVTVFIKSPWYVRVWHMLKRGDKLKSIINRLKLDRKEFKNFVGDLEFKHSNEMYKYFTNKFKKEISNG